MSVPVKLSFTNLPIALYQNDTLNKSLKDLCYVFLWGILVPAYRGTYVLNGSTCTLTSLFSC